MYRRTAIATIVAAALGVAACGSDSDTAPADSAAPVATAAADDTAAPADTAAPDDAAAPAVTIEGFAYTPASLVVKVGGTVTWTNEQDVDHTVTADDGSWTSGNLARAATFSQTFDTVGTFAYHCAIHPTMTANVIVED